jgi:sulfide:quinone oxidoreductase
VVAAGFKLRYDLIEGATEAMEDPDCPAGSMYRYDYCMKMRKLREDFRGGKAIFTQPWQPLKCGGAP